VVEKLILLHLPIAFWCLQSAGYLPGVVSSVESTPVKRYWNYSMYIDWLKNVGFS
jgi:hypothetical protein